MPEARLFGGPHNGEVHRLPYERREVRVARFEASPPDLLRAVLRGDPPELAEIASGVRVAVYVRSGEREGPRRVYYYAGGDG
jgi:hypothetical protein